MLRAPRRLIPAWAGKTLAASSAIESPRAHPRVSGENMSPPVSPPVTMGSSPRERGKPCLGIQVRSRKRLIPARAGKTNVLTVCYFKTRAHPRAGGENFDLPFTAERMSGSSPRGRGKLLVAVVREALRGLIPARAWKTRCSSWVRAPLSAHPRAGGENTVAAAPMAGPNGSSPHGRGKLPGVLDLVTVSGLIPAWAGKTLQTRCRKPARWAHPRAGVENERRRR